MNDDRALAACAEITRTEARNFHYGLRLLPERKRLALYAVYAWMRVLDDLADNDTKDAGAKAADLDRFEARTREAFELRADEVGDAREDAVIAGLAAVLRAFPADRADFLAAIEGQRMDLVPRAFACYAETELYCDRVASTVSPLAASSSAGR